MRVEILDLARDALLFLKDECANRDLDEKIIDKVLEVLLSTNPSNGFVDFASKS